MAKISLNKICELKKVDPIVYEVNGQQITIIQYLSSEQKANLVEQVLNLVIDDTGFLNPMRLEIYSKLKILCFYTNISITDKMIEEGGKTYDLLKINGILQAIFNQIPQNEYNYIMNCIAESAKHVIEYTNSFIGMMKTINTDSSSTGTNIEKIMNTLDQPDKIGLVKDILDKIG